MRILITEEALESGNGHWPNYIGDLSKSFRDAGDEVSVLTHKRATQDLLLRVGGTPWFSRNCWRDSRSQGKVGGLVHNWYFYRETLRYLKKELPFDRILALTMRLQHLIAFSMLSRNRFISPNTKFVLLFVQGFGRFHAPGVSTSFPKSISTTIAKLAFRWMSRNIQSGRVILAGETAGMCDELTRFTGLPTKLFPHPVHAETPNNNLNTTFTLRSKHCVTVSCPGFARHEKGSDLLLEAIMRILDSDLANRFRFILQWPEPFAMPSGELLSPYPQLVEDKRVEFRNQSLDSSQYAELLANSDFVILPYRASSYHQRLSRVAIEAAGMGVPLLYTAHTWTQEVADLVGCGVRIESESSGAIVEALNNAFTHREQLQAIAASNAYRVREFHSAATFRQLLN